MIHNREEWLRTPPVKAAPLPPTSGVLVCSPQFFDIIDVRNEHMKGQEGNVDKEKALQQWETYVELISSLGIQIHKITPQKDRVDAVFTANPSLCTIDSQGKTRAFLAQMDHPNRIPESLLHAEQYSSIGFDAESLPPIPSSWEGNGDMLRDQERALLWCGLGSRSCREGHIASAELLDLDIAFLDLPDPRYYHLDTALAILEPNTVAVVKEAFSKDGLDLIQGAFERVIEVDPDEAEERLAGNMWSPDGIHVFITSGSPVTITRLEAAGFRTIPVDTGEFLKSGGSVFCMRQEIRGEI